MTGLATTVGDLLLDTKKIIYGALGVFIDDLAADIPASGPGANQVQLVNSRNLNVGSLLDVDCESMLVQQFDPTTRTATVRRGWLRTDKVAHLAATQPIVEVNPRWPAGQLVNDLQSEILAWPDALYRPDYLDLDGAQFGDDFVRQVTLDATYNDVVGLPSARWIATDGSSIGLPKARLVQGPAGVYYIDLGTMVHRFATLTFVLARQFVVVPWTTTTTLESIGLIHEMYDIPPIGVALRRLGLDEIRRSDRQAQGEPRLDQANPANETVQGWAALQRLYDRRLRDEGDRLITRFRMRTW